MKAGLTTSLVMHAAFIGFGLVSLSSPKPLEVADVEALPVDIVSFAELTQVQKGDREAPVQERSAPKPTEKTESVENAVNTGDNEVDLKTPPIPDSRPKEVETATAPPPDPRPDLTEKPKTADDPAPSAEARPVPATEVTPEPAPKQDILPDPAEKPVSAENPDAEIVKLPDTAPVPQARPKPPQAQTAKAPERKDSEKPSPEEKKSASATEKKFDAGEIAELINREKPSGGGAQRSTPEAAAGGKETRGEKLSQNELDALRRSIEIRWDTGPFASSAGASDVFVTVILTLKPNGEFDRRPQISASGGEAQLRKVIENSVRQAVYEARPFNLPRDKYETWKEMKINFNLQGIYF